MIANCGTYTASDLTNTFHSCTTCDANYRLTDDNRKCLNVITDCGTYTASDVTNTFH